MAAITWRSLMGQNIDPIQAMNSAKSNIDGAFGSFNKLITQQQDARQYAENQQNEALKQSFLNDLYAVQGPEGLQAQRDTFNDRLGYLPPQLQGELRGQLDQRLNTLYSQDQAATAFGDRKLTQANAPLADDIRMLIASGNPEDLAKADALIRSNQQLTDQGELMQRLTAAQRQVKADTYADEDRGFTKEQREVTRKGWETQGNEDAAFDSLAVVSKAHRDNVIRIGQVQGAAAAAAGLPVTSNGLPDTLAIESNPAWKATYEEIQRENPLPSDTEAYNDFLSGLDAQGVSGKTLLGMREQGAAAFNTGLGNMLVGAERDALARNQEALTKRHEEVKAKNSLFISANNVVDQLPVLRKNLEDSGLSKEEMRIVQRQVVQRLKDYPDEPLNIPAIIAEAANSRSWGDGFWATLGNPMTFYEDTLKDNLNKLLNTEAARKQKQEYDANQNLELQLRRAAEAAANSGKVPIR